MDRPQAPFAFQETRLNLDTKSPESSVEILIPARTSSSAASRKLPKRRRIEEDSTSQDENTFSSSHIAIDSAVHFRPHSDSKSPKTPRTILWRVLENRKLLELQNLDVFQDSSVKTEPVLTLRFVFEKSIRPRGIAFAESERAGNAEAALTVFVLCTDGELHSLTLAREAWIKEDWLTEGMADWHRSCSPSCLTFRTPHRILVPDEKNIWLAMTDGGFVRLQRDPAQDGFRWTETYFSEGGWKTSLRGLVPWKSGTTRFGDIDIDAKAAAQILLSPDGSHLWTACLDHTVRVWDINEGKQVLAIDLANDPQRDLEKPVDHLMDPNYSTLLQIVPHTTSGKDDGYTVIMFSPHMRQFKFINVRDPGNAAFGYDEAFPDIEFAPPVEDIAGVSAWTLDTFYVKTDHDRRRHAWHFWMLIRCTSKTYVMHLSLDPVDRQKHLARDWKRHWTRSRDGLNSTSDLDQSFVNPGKVDIRLMTTDPSNIADDWLDYLLFPGRFSLSTLKTALVVYRRSLPMVSHSRTPVAADASALRLQMSDAIGSQVVLNYNKGGEPDFEAFQASIVSQWETFNGIVRNLHRQREHIVSLAIDPEQDQPWVAMSDFVAPLRKTTPLETIYHNRESLAQASHSASSNYLTTKGVFDDFKEAERLGKLFFACSTLTRSLSNTFLRSFCINLVADITVHSADDPGKRIGRIYENSHFADQIEDDQYESLIETLKPFGGFGPITTSIFETAVEYLDGGLAGQHHERRHFFHYGIATLVRGAQEISQAGYEALVDLLLLVVFMSQELEEEDLSRDFQASQAFLLLMGRLKQYDFLRWLLSTTCVDTRKAISSAPRTVHEQLFTGDIADLPSPAQAQTALITYYSQAWSIGMPLEKSFDSVAPYAMTELLKRNQTNAATQCVRFMPPTPWATYLRARLYLASREYDEAATLLEEAAEHLEGNIAVAQYDRGNLLDLDERNYFNAGRSRYYQHVVALFEKVKAFSHVSDFAELALNTLKPSGNADQAARADLLSRLFTAYLKTSRFDKAFGVLTQYTDFALRKTELRALITSLLLSPHAASLLLSLPFEAERSLAMETDDLLASLASATSVQATRSNDQTQYHKLIYAWRLERNDYRGAALIMWEYLGKLKFARATSNNRVNDEDAAEADEEIAAAYQLVINCLCLIEPDMAWMIVRLTPGEQSAASLGGKRRGVGDTKAKRKLVTLEDVRREWQNELDWRADTAAGRYPLSLEPELNGFNGDISIDERPNGDAMQVDVFSS